MNTPFFPKNIAATVRTDPQWGVFIVAELTVLHAFAVQLCERFGFTAADAGNLFDQATLLGMLDRSLSRPIPEEAARAWKSTLLNWIAHELKDVEAPLKAVLLKLSSAELRTLAPSFVSGRRAISSCQSDNLEI